MYEENVVLKQQIATMKQKICQADLAWKCDQMALQNVSKKLLREKMLRKKEDFGFRLQTDPIKDFSRLIPINKSHESVDRVQDWTTFSKEIKKGRGIEYQSSPLNRSEIQVTRKELLAPLRSQGELNNAMSHSKNGSIPITGQKTVETS